MAMYYPVGEKQRFPFSGIDPRAPSFTPGVQRPMLHSPNLVSGTTEDASSFASHLHSPRSLPIARFRKTIADKVYVNRVTLISGETGSGKSSQVPQILVEEALGPVLCTQPRRLAVVTVAKRVAKERGVELGEEVGYHIGQKKVSNLRCKIVFATCGVLLEDLRANGVKALAPYRTIVLDEVHERSVESDLVLCCIKQLMLKHHTIRLVLMSATADFQRYADYFREFGLGERIQRINIPNASFLLQMTLFSCRVKYLEQVVDELGKPPAYSELLEFLKACAKNSALANPVEMSHTIHSLVLHLIVHLHAKDPDTSHSIIVFLPTYQTLEQQWQLLQKTKIPFSVYALHSSIDIDLCIQAMETFHTNRKVILATNIAESSVTIPGVTYVIDLCRTVQLKWNALSKRHSARLVWSSVSQADQRKGRTGRTCNGVVYRLVPRSLFHTFPQFEEPASRLLSLRRQVLQLSSSESKAMFNPELLLSRCLDPPDPTVVSDSLNYLISIHALEKNKDKTNRHPPTFLGQLLVNLPLSLESALLVVHGGLRGILFESVVLAAVLETSPKPIIQPFAQKEQFIQYLRCYEQENPWLKDDAKSSFPSYSFTVLANCNAFYFWQRSFKDQKRLQTISDFVNGIESSSSLPFPSFPSYTSGSQEWQEEQEWCLQHHLLQSALHSIEGTIFYTFEALYRSMPSFLSACKGAPTYFLAPYSDHSCHIVSNPFKMDKNGEEKNSGFNYPSFDPNSKGSVIDQKSDWNWNYRDNDSDDDYDDDYEEEEDELDDDDDDDGDDDDLGQSISNSQNMNFLDDICIESPFVKNGSLTPLPLDTILKAMLKEDWSTGSETFNNHADGENGENCVNGDTEFSLAGENNVDTKDTNFSLKESNVPAKPSCIFFLRGNCTRGNTCSFSHSPMKLKNNSTSKPSEDHQASSHEEASSMSSNGGMAQCVYFFSAKGCRYGSECIFSHSALSHPSKLTLHSVEEMSLDPSSTQSQSKTLFTMPNSDKLILIFGQEDFSFSVSLLPFLSDPSRLYSTSTMLESEILSLNPEEEARFSRLRGVGATVLFGLNAGISYQTQTGIENDLELSNSVSMWNSLPWERIGRVIWNCDHLGSPGDTGAYETWISSFFSTLSCPLLLRSPPECRILITMKQEQFVRWHVLKASRETFLFLDEYVPFDSEVFSSKSSSSTNNPNMPSKSITYSFRLQKPPEFPTLEL